MIVHVNIRNKMASAQPRAEIVCGNSDYRVHFHFDDEEWNAYPLKTARFVCRGDTPPARYMDIVFAGDICDIPPLYETDEVEIGVYAGNIRTTSAARIPCVPCITDGAQEHTAPPQDVYDQLLEQLSQMESGVINPIGGYTALHPAAAAGIAGYAAPLGEKEE